MKEIIKIVQNSDIGSVIDNAVSPLYDFIEAFIPALFGIVLAVGVIFAIIAGVKMSRASGTSEYAEAKQHFIHIIIGFGLAILFTTVLFATRESILDLISNNTDF